MAFAEPISYEGDPNYAAFLAQPSPPWRQGLAEEQPDFATRQLDLDARHEVVLANLGVVASTVRHMADGGTPIDWDEALQDGSVGLVDAAERFDPALGVRFPTYAQHRAQGEIVDGYRRFNKLQGRGRDEPTVVSQLNGTRALSIFQPVYSMSHGGVVTIADTVAIDDRSVEDVVTSWEAVGAIETAVSALEPRQQTVIRLRVQALSYRAIAEAIGFSKSTVGRDLSKARATLRNVLMPQLEDV
jgi:RNA polymerase sigma factor (sigma-70 family)